MNKKLLALLLAILMVAMSAVAMAETQTTLNDITKIYTTDTVLPVETLSFTATAQSAVKADGTEVTESIGAPILRGSVATSAMTKDGTVEGKYTATVSISSSATWPFAGTYTYSVSEDAGNIQGVTYAANSINFKVLVGYAVDEDGNPTQNLEAQDIQLVVGEGQAKEGSFTNAYNSGSVKVTKTVSGNAASTTDTFNVDVTFAVASGKVFSENVQIGGISGQTISEDKTKITGTITVKHGDTITLSNIPVGTTVTVAENDTKVNAPEGTDATKYTATYSGNGAVVSSAAQTIAITNSRTSSIETGVTTDSMPYILLMAFVAILAVAFVAKKRSVKE